MMAYYFRTMNEEWKPTGYIGLVFGANREELFWAIDEFCDPAQVEVMNAHRGGVCWKEGQRIKYDQYDDDTEYEKADITPMIDDEGWRKPDWSRINPVARAIVNVF